MNEHRYFNGKKYCLNQNRWISTINPRTLLSHDVWNYYNPNDKIEECDGNIIHHKDKNKSNDNIENLQKMTIGEHNSLHHTGIKHSEDAKEKMSKTKIGEKNYNWKGGMKYKSLYLGYETIEKNVYYRIRTKINSLGDVGISYFDFENKRAQK